MLVHANRIWLDNITENLWTYDVRMVSDTENNISNIQSDERNTPFQMFTKIKVNENPKHFILVGCPVYFID